MIADYVLDRAVRATEATKDARFVAARVDASDEEAVTDLLRRHRCDVLLNAMDPRFVMPLFRAAPAARIHYLDMAMSLSRPHPDHPYSQTGVMLGDEQFALATAWERTDRLALVGVGVEPGLSDVFARYAADHLFDEIGVRDGANLTGDRTRGKTCAGTWVKGVRDGAPREVYLYHVVDNEWSMTEYGSQAVVWQTALNPVIALEPLSGGQWKGSGALGPEALPAEPFLGLLEDYGAPWGMREQ